MTFLFVFQGNSAPPPLPPPKIETVQPAAPTSYVIPESNNSTAKIETTTPKKSDQSPNPALKSKDPGSNPDAAATNAAATAAASVASAEEYQAINDRLNRIEKLISDLMVKVDDKTRSIEKSVAKVKSSKSKHASHKPQSVTICVDSPSASGAKDGNNCDQEQFL